MAFDAFIKIDGIDGESTDNKHNRWIELLSCGVTVSQKVSETDSSAGGTSSERADFSDFSFIKQKEFHNESGRLDFFSCFLLPVDGRDVLCH
jgi:type VI protein secretion system component Hcp